jgi:hypothetical protein
VGDFVGQSKLPETGVAVARMDLLGLDIVQAATWNTEAYLEGALNRSQNHPEAKTTSLGERAMARFAISIAIATIDVESEAPLQRVC